MIRYTLQVLDDNISGGFYLDCRLARFLDVYLNYWEVDIYRLSFRKHYAFAGGYCVFNTHWSNKRMVFPKNCGIFFIIKGHIDKIEA